MTSQFLSFSQWCLWKYPASRCTGRRSESRQIVFGGHCQIWQTLWTQAEKLVESRTVSYGSYSLGGFLKWLFWHCIPCRPQGGGSMWRVCYRSPSWAMADIARWSPSTLFSMSPRVTLESFSTGSHYQPIRIDRYTRWNPAASPDIASCSNGAGHRLHVYISTIYTNICKIYVCIIYQ